MKCQLRPGGHDGIFSRASWTRLSPKIRWPVAAAKATSDAGWVLETATRRISDGSRPARCAVRAMSSRMAEILAEMVFIRFAYDWQLGD